MSYHGDNVDDGLDHGPAWGPGRPRGNGRRLLGRRPSIERTSALPPIPAMPRYHQLGHTQDFRARMPAPVSSNVRFLATQNEGRTSSWGPTPPSQPLKISTYSFPTYSHMTFSNTTLATHQYSSSAHPTPVRSNFLIPSNEIYNLAQAQYYTAAQATPISSNFQTPIDEHTLALDPYTSTTVSSPVYSDSLTQNNELYATLAHHRLFSRGLDSPGGWIRINTSWKEAKNDSLELLQLEMKTPQQTDFGTMYTDASRSNTLAPSHHRSCAIAVTWRVSATGKWHDRVWKVFGTPDTQVAERLAIEKAMEVAVHTFETASVTPPFTIFIFSDAQSLLARLRKTCEKGNLEDPYVRPLLQHHKRLRQLGVYVQLRWVPARRGVEGNARADELAHRGRNFDERRRRVRGGISYFQMRDWDTSDEYWNRRGSREAGTFTIDDSRQPAQHQWT